MNKRKLGIVMNPYKLIIIRDALDMINKAQKRFEFIEISPENDTIGTVVHFTDDPLMGYFRLRWRK